MSAYLMIILIEAVVLLAVWRWDERARRAERDRRRQQRRAQANARKLEGASGASSAGGRGPVAALSATP